MRVTRVDEYSALEVEVKTDMKDWRIFRRYGAEDWEVYCNESWELYDSPSAVEELEAAFQQFMKEQDEYLKSFSNVPDSSSRKVAAEEQTWN